MFKFMECDFIGMKMRFRPLNFGCYLLASWPKPTYSMKFNLPNKSYKSSTSSSLCSRVKFSSSVALDTIEPDPTCSFTRTDSKNSRTQGQESRAEVPGKTSSHNRSGFLYRTERNVRGGVLNFCSKEELKRYSGMLRECASKGSLNEGKAIHGYLIKSSIEPDTHLWVSLINFYAKCGDQVLARRVLDRMTERDIVSWTAVISGSVSEGNGRDGVSMYREMRDEDIKPNEFALATALKACSLCLDLEFGKQIQAEAIKTGLFYDLFVGSALVDLYAKCGDVVLADRVLSGMPEKNAVSWNALLNGYAQTGGLKEVLRVFCRMTEIGMRFSPFTLSTVLKGCANSGSLQEGKVLHSLVIRSGCELDEFLGGSLVDVYSKCGLAYDALKVFNGIKNPDIVAWSAIIAALDQQGHSQEAVEQFHLMRLSGIRPNQFSLASLLSSAANMGDLHLGRSIHACAYKYESVCDNSVGNALITMYMKCGCVQDGARVFYTMTNQDLVSWNAFLSGFQDFETCHQGPRIFRQMLVKDLKPNMYTFISILRSCSSLLDVGFGKQVHAHIIKNNINCNDFVGTALIDMYAKVGCLEDADVAFKRTIARDLFTWTVIIAGYAQTNQAEKALEYLCQMQREGIKPNEFSLSSCLSGCSRMATLENGRQLHSVAIKAGHFGDVFVSSALIDMYGKCGCMQDAEAIFKGLASRDTVSWNTIICGYSQHGQGNKALKAFGMMLDEGIAPDEVTFIGVLSACSYMGLVEEGNKFFDLMTNVHAITPSIVHCACMVDILGRAGKFREIEIFIEEMKLTPNPLIWETILGACKLHGNVDFGERAANELFKLEPRMDSSYIMLSNIFAAKGRWDDVRNIRTLMTNRGVKKEPGCSWVEVDGQVHVFISQESSHPKLRQIHDKLEELSQKLNAIGYKPNMENVLQNVTDKEKIEHLLYHSERLALAYALISSKSAKTIRIFKNLRICGDCHNVMKLLSKVINQEIIVRDIKHFHHFKEGNCSCQDYW